MKRLFIPCMVLLWACGCEAKKEEAPAAAPPALSNADLAGMFNGTTMVANGDSVTATWTSVVTVDSAGTAQGKWVNLAFPTDTVRFTQKISGDSAIAESAPYTDRSMPNGSQQVRWKAVGRMKDGGWSGTTDVMPAGKDTVIAKVRWKSMRTP